MKVVEIEMDPDQGPAVKTTQQESVPLDSQPIEEVFNRIVENSYHLWRLRRGIQQDEASVIGEKLRIAAELSSWINQINEINLVSARRATRRAIMPVINTQSGLPPPSRYIRRTRRSHVQIG